MKKQFILIFSIFTFSILSACNSTTAESGSVRIAALPVLDTLPIYVAQDEGLFDNHDIQVEVLPAGSAPKRDEMMIADQADGMVNEVVSTIFYNRNETQIQIVRYARTATIDTPIFFILSSESSGMTNLDNLKGEQIGVSQGTVIEYLTDRLLQSEGFNNNEIMTIAVPDIGQRMALLGAGELNAAMLPDPLASLARQQGAKVLLDDSSHPEYSHSTIAFRKDFIDQNPETIRNFLAAWEEAVMLINENPQKYADLMVAKELVPPPLVDSFPVPQFATADVPTRDQWDDCINWVKEKNLETGNANYADSIRNDFLP
jgi:NitT/TauT family transport system substrate-binding protein